MLMISHLSGFNAGGDEPPLDGYANITGAWSMSRQMLSSYGGALYATSTGVSSLNDQSGNSRNLAQGTGGAQPTVGTGGPKGRTCAVFDGTDDVLSYSTPSNLISTTAGYVAAVVIIDSIGTNNGTNFWNNDHVWTTGGANVGIFMRSSGPTLYGLNGNTVTSHTISTGTLYVIEWRHESGTIYSRLNGGTEQSIADGGASTFFGSFIVGGGNHFSDVNIFEMCTFTTIPSATLRDRLVANMIAYYA